MCTGGAAACIWNKICYRAKIGHSKRMKTSRRGMALSRRGGGENECEIEEAQREEIINSKGVTKAGSTRLENTTEWLARQKQNR